MKPSHKLTPQDAIQRYVDRRKQTQWPISIAEAVKAVRRDLPDTDLLNDDLAVMVSIAAVLAHHAISFDADLLKRDQPR